MTPNEAATKAIDLASKHADHNDSAMLCLSDAIECAEGGLYPFAIDRAATSLAHSVGVFHPDYATCRSLTKGQAQ